MPRRWVGLSVLVAGIFLVASACSPTIATAPPTPSTSGVPAKVQTGGEFRFGQAGEVLLLDPWNVSDQSSLLVTRQIYEGLVDYEGQTLKIGPRLAEMWERSVDGRQWTFTLRRGVKFHDGTDLTAEAVVFNFERARSSANEYRPTKPVGDDFSSYKTQWGGLDADSMIAKVEAKDPITVVFTTRVPFGPFLPTMAMPNFALVSPRSIRDDRDRWMLPASKAAAGTGPFAFRPGAWEKDRQIALEKNPGYWQKDTDRGTLPHLDRVVIRVIRDAPTRLAELKSGSVDAVRDFSPQDISTVKSDPNLQVMPRPSLNVAYLGVNVSMKPLDDLKVRQAIAMAINRKAIVDAVYAGEAKVASQFIVPGMLGYDDSVTDFYKYDTDGAKKLLAAYPNGIATDLWYVAASRPYYPDPRRVAEALAADLAKVGITVSLKSVDLATYRADARGNKYPLWLFGWTGDNSDPDQLMAMFAPSVVAGSDAPATGSAWSNPTAWDLLRKARSSTDDSRRAELYKQVSKIVQKEVPSVPMFHANPLTAATRKVKGFVPHPTGGETFTLVSITK